MRDLCAIEFAHEFHVYSLALNWDEVQLSEGKIDVEVVAARRHRLSGENEVVANCHVIVEIDEERGALLKITVAEQEVFVQPLAELVEDDSAVGRFLEEIPSYVYGGDPFIGCLIRSGASATVGQIVRCKDETSAIPWIVERVRAISSCLLHNIPNILTKSMARAIHCIFSAG